MARECLVNFYGRPSVLDISDCARPIKRDGDPGGFCRRSIWQLLEEPGSQFCSAAARNVTAGDALPGDDQMPVLGRTKMAWPRCEMHARLAAR